MKKLVLVLVIMFMATFAYATDPTTTTIKEVGAGGQYAKYIYTLPTVTSGDGDTVFRIDTRGFMGTIHEVFFESASTDCDIWISEDTAMKYYSDLTIIHITTINLGTKIELSAPIYYVNQDGSTEDKYLYLTVDNQDAVNATGATSNLVLTFERF